MKNKDLYVELCKFSEKRLGPNPNRQLILQALKQTIPEEDLVLYFLLPSVGSIPLSQLHKKAEKSDFSKEKIDAAIERLHQQAFVMRNFKEEKFWYERCELLMTAEQQVRLRKGTPLGAQWADYWRGVATQTVKILPTKTPYLRTLPVQEEIKKKTKTVNLNVNVTIPDPSKVVPLDSAMEILKQQEVIGVAECYCRVSQDFIGNHCEKPRETCFVFNDFAQSLKDRGLARILTIDEAMEILEQCEKAGLVHNVDNIQSQIRIMCNCCSCHCPAIQAIARGQKNISAVSHFIPKYDSLDCVKCLACVEVCPIGAVKGENGEPVFDQELCIGCGLCVSRCMAGALTFELRQNAPRVPKSGKELFSRQMREAIIGMVKNKLVGRKE